MRLFLWLVISIGFFLISIRHIERHCIYFPMKEAYATPKLAGLAYEEIYFITSDNKRLNGWYIPNDKAYYTVIFCHGNAGNISHRMEKILIFHELGLNTFIFDYRGYGKSEGIPSERGLYEDARASYDYLVKEKRISKDRIILYGESIGGAVAIDLARDVSVRALITEETLSSVKDMVKLALPYIPDIVFSSRFDSLSKIRKIACPKLIIHSIDDEIVPFCLGKALFDAAAPPKKFLEVRGSHNTAFLESEEGFKEGIKSFLSDLI